MTVPARPTPTIDEPRSAEANGEPVPFPKRKRYELADMLGPRRDELLNSLSRFQRNYWKRRLNEIAEANGEAAPFPDLIAAKRRIRFEDLLTDRRDELLKAMPNRTRCRWQRKLNRYAVERGEAAPFPVQLQHKIEDFNGPDRDALIAGLSKQRQWFWIKKLNQHAAQCGKPSPFPEVKRRRHLSQLRFTRDHSPEIVAMRPIISQMVCKARKKYSRFHVDDELHGIGMMSVAKACRDFDPTRGVPLEAFARQCIELDFRGFNRDEIRKHSLHQLQQQVDYQIYIDIIRRDRFGNPLDNLIEQEESSIYVTW